MRYLTAAALRASWKLIKVSKSLLVCPRHSWRRSVAEASRPLHSPFNRTASMPHEETCRRKMNSTQQKEGLETGREYCFLLPRKHQTAVLWVSPEGADPN